MKENIASQYLQICKEFHERDIIPAISIQIRDENYDEIKGLSEKIIRENGINSFAEFFQEGQYLVQLWTAHLILENNNTSDELKHKSLLVIKDYTDNPLVPKVSVAENVWFNKFYPNF